jgi:hypothetical protein
MLAKLIQSRWTSIAWTLVIFFLMIMPPQSVPSQGLFSLRHLDKLVHICLFGGFVWLWYMSRLNSNKNTAGTGVLVRLFLISASYGIVLEFVQYFFTNRDFDIWDIVADIIVSPYGNMGRNQN